MSMQRERYPANWEAISQRIRFERAGGKCEQCGAKHGDFIYRYIRNPAKFLSVSDPDFDEKLFWDAEDISVKATKVILTVHHIGIDRDDGSPGDVHDKMDCRDANLIALCQRCHLLADLSSHMANAKVTRLKKKHAVIQAAGQKTLFEVSS